jgi:hypothetical protein
MSYINHTLLLRNQIQLLESEQAIKGQDLKEQFYIVYESLKPLNLLLRTLKDVSSSPNLIDNVLGTTIGLASGYLSKKIFIGSSGNLIRKLIGSALQFGVTDAVRQHPDSIKSLGQFILQHLFRKKEANSTTRAR